MQTELHRILTYTFLILKYVFIWIRKFLLELYIAGTEGNWTLSRNHNFYNRTLEATVYRYGNNWSIARYGRYSGSYERKESAMEEIFQIWLKENNMEEKVGNLKSKLEDVKNIINNKLKKYLYVPYHDKDKVKSLGAEWCYKKKNWYIPFGLNENLFETWIYNCTSPNFKADYFYLAQTSKQCYKCQSKTKVYAIVLPIGFERLTAIDDLEEEPTNSTEEYSWIKQDYFSILSYISEISDLALEKIKKYADNYSLNYSNTTHSYYFISSCTSCSAIQGDNFVISEFNSPFHPIEVNNFKNIIFYKIDTRIDVRASESSFEYIPIQHYLGDKSSCGLVRSSSIYKI
jgi:hypothetical protein